MYIWIELIIFKQKSGLKLKFPYFCRLRYFSSKFDKESSNPCACPCCPQPCNPCEKPDICDPYKKPRKVDPCKSKKKRKVKFCGRSEPKSPDPIPPPPRHPTPCKPRREDCDECWRQSETQSINRLDLEYPNYSRL